MRAHHAVQNAPATRTARIAQAIATVAAWLAFLVLWAPAFAALGALAGWRPVWLTRYLTPPGDDLQVLAAVAGLTVAGSLTLVLWAANERRRFAGLDRRRRRPAVDISVVGQSLHADPHAVAALQSGQVVRVHCRPDGSVAVAEVLVPQAAEPLRTVGDSCAEPMARMPSQRRPPVAMPG